jgi:hypothetical protein
VKPVKFLSVLVAAAALSIGCSKDEPVAVSNDQDQKAVEVDEALPQGAIIRVTLDANGNAVKGSESMKFVSGVISDAVEASDFDSASNVTLANQEELDSTDASGQVWSLTTIKDSSLSGMSSFNNGGYNGGYNGDYNGGAQYPNQRPTQQGDCTPCDQSAQWSDCVPCEQPARNTVEHRQGPSRVERPVSRRTIYEHRTRDIQPVEYVDVIPVETVRIHPTQTVTRVHPVVQQVQYVGNHCNVQQQNGCGYGAQYYPTVQQNGYQQYYHYQSTVTQGNHRYFRYCRPTLFHRWRR